MKSLPSLLLVVLFLGGCASPEPRSHIRARYEKDDIVGPWFGFAWADIYVYRLELASDGSGCGAISFRSEVPETFGVQRWSLDGTRVLIEAESGAGIARFEGHLFTSTMFAGTVYGASGWSNQITFYKEEPFTRRVRDLHQAMGTNFLGTLKMPSADRDNAAMPGGSRENSACSPAELSGNAVR